MLTKNPKNLWNDFNLISGKQLDLYLRPHMLELEDQAVNLIQKELTEKQKADFYTELFKGVRHDVIRYKRLKK